MKNKNKVFALIIFVLGLISGIFLILIVQKFQGKYDFSQSVLNKKIIKIDDKIWTSADLPNDLLLEYTNIENNIYNAQKRFADHLALRVLLAKEENKAFNSEYIPGLFELLPFPQKSEHEAREYFDKMVKEHGVNVFSGQSFDKIKAQIQYQLNYEQLNSLAEKKIEQYFSANKYEIYVSAPLGNPVLFNVNKYPKRGNTNTNFSLISVLDFNDQKSIELEYKVEKIYHKYGKKINFINIPYAANFESTSGYFAKGAYCAQEQGNEKFWEFYQKSLAKNKKNKNEMNINDKEIMKKNVVEVAESVKLNIDNFKNCLGSKKIADTLISVQNQLYSTNGFKGAPALYLNRRELNISLNDLEKNLQNELY